MENFWGEPNDRPHKVEGPCAIRTFNAVIVGVAAGTFFGACSLAWFPDPITSSKRFGGVSGKSDIRAVARSLARPSFWMASAAASFAAVECLAEKSRGKQDSWNAALGGMAAGAVLGSMSRRADIMTSSALGMGLFLFALDFSGPSTIQESKQKELNEKMYGVLPLQHKESDALSALKKTYPKFKNL